MSGEELAGFVVTGINSTLAVISGAITLLRVRSLKGKSDDDHDDDLD
jgi:hypothetical protein